MTGMESVSTECPVQDTLLLGLKMASPCSILARAFCASSKETFMKDGWTITRLMYSVR